MSWKSDWSWHVNHAAGLKRPYRADDSAREAGSFAVAMQRTMLNPCNWTPLAMPLAGGWVPQIQAWVANQLITIRPIIGTPVMYEALIVIGPTDKELFRATADSERKVMDVVLRDFLQHQENLVQRIHGSIAELTGVRRP